MLLTTMCQTPLQAMSKTDKIIIFVELNSRRKAIKKQISRNLPANAGDMGSIPGPGISHACSTCRGATKPVHH